MNKICLRQTVHRRIFIFAAILALTVLFCTPQLDAEIYEWIDENGVKHYGNMPPADAKNVRIMGYEYRHDADAHQERVKADKEAVRAMQQKSNVAKKKQPSSRPEKAITENSCYIVAKVDVRVIVWPADQRGNKGEKLWEGVLKKGERKLIHTPHGYIRYASRRNLDDDQLFSGDKGRWCHNGQRISVP